MSEDQPIVTKPYRRLEHIILSLDAHEPPLWAGDLQLAAEFAASIASRTCAACQHPFSVAEWYSRHVTMPNQSGAWWSNLHLALMEGSDINYHAACCPFCGETVWQEWSVRP